MDHIDSPKSAHSSVNHDMRNLIKPRGRGYSLRAITPEVLIGTTNSWTEKPFGKEIRLGLATRVHAEAVRLRDIRLGQLRQLEADANAALGKRSVGRIIDLSSENAERWRVAIEEERSGDGEGVAHSVLLDKLEDAEGAGYIAEANSFGRRVFHGAIPIEEALETYLEERKPVNPFGYDPLAITTALNVRSSVKHLIKFLAVDQPTLHDVTEEKAFEFRKNYLPLVAQVKPATVAKHMTLLGGLWKWAIVDKTFLRTHKGEPFLNPWLGHEKGTSKRKADKKDPGQGRTMYQADEVTKLLSAFPVWGSRQGDIMRLAMATGGRVDEIGSLMLADVEDGGTAFTVQIGKSENARRLIPLAEDAQRLMVARVAASRKLQAGTPESDQRLFPEWPLKPSTRKANSVSQWFTRFRRKTLGAETDDKLAMHSFRHTWATMARSAGVQEDRVKELGGWTRGSDASSICGHGLTEAQLREAKEKVWFALQDGGYLKTF